MYAQCSNCCMSLKCCWTPTFFVWLAGFYPSHLEFWGSLHTSNTRAAMQGRREMHGWAGNVTLCSSACLIPSFSSFAVFLLWWWWIPGLGGQSVPLLQWQRTACVRCALHMLHQEGKAAKAQKAPLVQQNPSSRWFLHWLLINRVAILNCGMAVLWWALLL